MNAVLHQAGSPVHDTRQGLADETDREILRLLQHDARMPNARIARQLGFSATWIQKRIARLRRHGLIEGFAAVVDPEKLGPSVLAFAKVQLCARDERARQAFLAALQSNECVLECHALAGAPWHFMLKVRVADIDACHRLLLQSGWEAFGVCRVRVTMAVEEVKRRSEPPL